jgi:hypothetical protein
MKRINLRPGSLLFSALLAAFVFAGCQKNEKRMSCGPDGDNTEVLSTKAMNSDDEFKKGHQKLHWRTLWELLQVRWATAKYRNIDAADRDGYKTINVKVQNMGHHYMKATLNDDKFDLTRPEILVYRKNEQGKFQLVAVEYAMPFDKPEPRGFFGDDDHWDHNTTFNLWLLHAWVWYKNPAGVFNPTNPNVITQL